MWRDFLVHKYFACGIRRFFAADVTANDGNARAGVRLSDDITGGPDGNKGTGSTKKANDASIFVSGLLGH
jgi:hypothetical protein